MIRIRMTGSRNDANSLITALHGIDDIEHVEEIDDLAPRMREDSSSSELVDDSEGGVYVIEVDTPDDMHADAVRDIALSQARALDAGIEFLDDF
jgi:hypothetical protein